MILDYDTILSKIIDTSGLSREDIEKKIKQKQSDLQDLISREGAAHIIANELGVKLFDGTTKTLKINQVQVGLNSVTLLGKVMNIYEIKSFEKNGRKGRIGSMLLGDETGAIRIVIWDEKLIDLIKEIKQEDTLKLSNAYSKQNANGFKELHLGSKSQIIINPENELIKEVRTNTTTFTPAEKKKIRDLNAPGFAEVFGTIVQVFEPKHYNSCPVCSKKVMPIGDKFTCQDHGEVKSKKVPILNIYFDDGTGNIRAVLFREHAENILNNKVQLDEIKKECLGKQLILKGKITKNEMFNRMEMNISYTLCRLILRLAI